MSDKDITLEDETVKLVHDVISDLQKEGFVITGCDFCNNNYPVKVARCRICGKICFPKDQTNN